MINTSNTSNTKTFPVLYGKSKTNKVKMWSITVENHGDHSIITTLHGYEDGKKQETKITVKSGKNIGKANETSHFQQACSEAESKWNKKKDNEGYTLQKEKNASSGIVEKEKTKTCYFPMLAQDFKKHQSKVTFPAFVQPKLDGYRMIYSNGECTSRQGKSFETIKSTKKLFSELQQVKDIILDGELYIHNGTFEHLGLLRKKKLNQQDMQKLEQIEYHVYDIVDDNLSFKKRLNKLKDLEIKSWQRIKIVQTQEVNSVEDIQKFHEKVTKDNYEGTMVRNANGKYKCKYRSYDLLKFKDFEDSEYPIVDFTFEKDTSGNLQDLIIWICETPNKDYFRVRPQGTQEERRKLFNMCQEDFSRFKGKNLWVKYFELSDKNVPRFPSTMRSTYTQYIRDIIE